MSEKKEPIIRKIVEEELVWAEKVYEGDHMDCWINGYCNALRTVLRKAKEEAVR